MKKVLMFVIYLLGFLWVLPVNILAWVWLLYMRLTVQVEEVIICSDLSLIWDIDNGSSFFKRMEGWFGFVIGSNIICIDVKPDEEVYEEHIKHETTHVHQQYIFGILFFPVYIITSIILYFFVKKSHPYFDNFFERWARKKAGQPVELSEEQREKYMKDRWMWW